MNEPTVTRSKVVYVSEIAHQQLRELAERDRRQIGAEADWLIEQEHTSRNNGNTPARPRPDGGRKHTDETHLQEA